MLTQKEFVRKCYDRYKALDLIPGNPNDGCWAKAHYPLPHPEGKRWIWLLHDDHQIQGILQSEEVGRRCFFAGDVKPFLQFNWCDDWFEIFNLYEKWQALQISILGKSHVENSTGCFGMSEEDRFMANLKGGKIGGLATFENGTGLFSMSEEEKFEANSKGGKIGGKIGGKVTASMTHISTATGFVSNPSRVALHNKSQGHPKEAKARIPDEYAHLFTRVGSINRSDQRIRKEQYEINARNLALFYELFPDLRNHSSVQCSDQ